ncbi:hypothetical protein M408DRAFT_326705 [Serendipita vermifera MAFF 305830]|uniref:Uncharacterized protein n=1 Tax=Serendipita vermifera MAFF 305830 TaxID=933852 RepID=A0A0C3B8A1_SERVB|nr:hypothetical protein M408DRAFT_326705 [Serendipita vermifera MAFF 305830]
MKRKEGVGEKERKKRLALKKEGYSVWFQVFCLDRTADTRSPFAPAPVVGHYLRLEDVFMMGLKHSCLSKSILAVHRWKEPAGGLYSLLTNRHPSDGPSIPVMHLL